MATSGVFTGSRGGTGTGPYLKLYWNRIDEDVSNNRSKLRLSLHLISEYSISFSASKSGNLEGAGFTYSSGFYAPDDKVIKTRDIWVNHDTDGSKSIYLNATFDIEIKWSGIWVGEYIGRWYCRHN